MPKTSSETSHTHTETHDGPIEDMLQSRADKLPKCNELIQEGLKDYDGAPLVLITAKANKDGTGVNVRQIIVGTGNGHEQIAIVKALNDAEKVVEKQIEGMIGDPSDMIDKLMEALKSASSSHSHSHKSDGKSDKKD